MTEAPDESRIEHRAELLPEELAAGTEDAEEQARVILEESDDRTEHPERTRHESTQTPDESGTA
ncbi:MAG TPA: hypothetical protein VFJ94_06285 [Intrasporangium sp.]|uniref:hypothetical protein n=1 Tax=Intrasporangium sp. TaxID=1925024 RepID=UPI002D78927A|nr:hypothetical protein [Intrasporangium sp.]HET7398112.1 hypothetical protein [Intrasporangium sp.]